ncbi:hypothetical protein Tco_1168141, partial [Tanacetum coccineum]
MMPACKEKLGNEEAQIKEAGWHPMKVVIVDDEPKVQLFRF